MSEIHITGIKAADLPEYYPHLAGYFKSFEDRAEGELTAADLVREIARKERQCWIAFDSKRIRACALTTMAGEGNPKRTVTIDFCAGDGRDDWRDEIVAEIDKWRKAMGSDRLRVICRPGWTRELKKMGFRETHRVLEMD